MAFNSLILANHALMGSQLILKTQELPGSPFDLGEWDTGRLGDYIGDIFLLSQYGRN